MRRKLRVLYVTAECAPYAKAGGLGEVSAALPKALSLNNVDIRRVLPLHRGTSCDLKYKCDFSVKMGDKFETCIVKTDATEKDVPAYFVANDYYFNRDDIYKFYDDGERFLFLCKAVVEMLKHIPFKPDIIHCNDWHTGFLPLLLKKEGFKGKTIYTIHNLKYQGCIGADYFENLTEDEMKELGYPGCLNFMSAGLLHSDYITTVSESYAKEMLSQGFGMDDILSKRTSNIRGILNGIDDEKYDPSKEGDLKIPYSIENIDDKKKNKDLLQRELGLEVSNVPLIAAVTRLTEVKGIDIMLEGLLNINKPFQFVLLGSGNMYYEKILEEIAGNYMGKIVVNFKYDEDLAKRIYAGSDMFLMPSLYEPCGLGQLYAMRYGSIPIVRHTGGLRDTVVDFNKNPKKGNGFTFEEYSADALVKTVEEAIEVYNTSKWQTIIKNAMTCDWSWKKSAEKYLTLYNELISMN